MELFSHEFQKSVEKIINDKSCIVIATLPLKGRINFVEKLKKRKDSKLYELTKNNRNSSTNFIIKCLFQLIDSKTNYNDNDNDDDENYNDDEYYDDYNDYNNYNNYNSSKQQNYNNYNNYNYQKNKYQQRYYGGNKNSNKQRSSYRKNQYNSNYTTNYNQNRRF